MSAHETRLLLGVVALFEPINGYQIRRELRDGTRGVAVYELTDQGRDELATLRDIEDGSLKFERPEDWGWEPPPDDQGWQRELDRTSIAPCWAVELR